MFLWTKTILGLPSTMVLIFSWQSSRTKNWRQTNTVLMKWILQISFLYELLKIWLFLCHLFVEPIQEVHEFWDFLLNLTATQFCDTERFQEMGEFPGPYYTGFDDELSQTISNCSLRMWAVGKMQTYSNRFSSKHWRDHCREEHYSQADLFVLCQLALNLENKESIPFRFLPALLVTKQKPVIRSIIFSVIF